MKSIITKEDLENFLMTGSKVDTDLLMVQILTQIKVSRRMI